ncbi:hypothetical protein [Rhizobium sp. BE258]|uniref:hypothetical protein n=1 Tax=Rhizobium sp. BE258 TaxID=2817722 RepID=UPI0028597AC9|nr:hypothetical protein [Rhizobium sp. BE258]MDR7145198.1 MYXO-CTERM domain-containing protein [Rhizobium sp. BE258]
MKLRYLALAGAVAFSAPAFAATPVLHDNPSVSTQPATSAFTGLVYVEPSEEWNNQTQTSTFTLATSGIWSFWTVAKADPTANGLFSAKLLDSVGNLVKRISFEIDGSEGSYVGKYWDNLSLAAGNYSIVIKGSAFTNSGITGAAAGITQTAPVPGPEAGAGLGALALGGLALYMTRRRKGDVAAV